MIRIVPDDAGAALAASGANGKGFVRDFEVASYDGQWFYLVHSYESTKGTRSGPAGSGWRARSDHPGFSASSELLALWATYASSGYFAERSSNSLHSLRPGGSESPTGGPLMLGKWVLSKTPPFLPLSIDVSGKRVSESEAWTPSEQSAFSPDTTARITGFTNIGGLLLPVAARVGYYTRYVPAPGGAEHEVVRGLSVSATNVTTRLAKDGFVPDLPDPTALTEARLVPGSGLRFARVTTNRWPSEAAVSSLIWVDSFCRSPLGRFFTWDFFQRSSWD